MAFILDELIKQFQGVDFLNPQSFSNLNLSGLTAASGKDLDAINPLSPNFFAGPLFGLPNQGPPSQGPGVSPAYPKATRIQDIEGTQFLNRQGVPGATELGEQFRGATDVQVPTLQQESTNLQAGQIQRNQVLRAAEDIDNFINSEQVKGWMDRISQLESSTPFTKDLIDKVLAGGEMDISQSGEFEKEAGRRRAAAQGFSSSGAEQEFARQTDLNTSDRLLRFQATAPLELEKINRGAKESALSIGNELLNQISGLTLASEQLKAGAQVPIPNLTAAQDAAVRFNTADRDYQEFIDLAKKSDLQFAIQSILSMLTQGGAIGGNLLDTYIGNKTAPTPDEPNFLEGLFGITAGSAGGTFGAGLGNNGLSKFGLGV